VVAYGGFRGLRNHAKNGLWLCELIAVRRQSGIAAVGALKRIVEFLRVSADVLYSLMQALSEHCSYSNTLASGNGLVAAATVEAAE
jgi:hypothetical protein